MIICNLFVQIDMVVSAGAKVKRFGSSSKQLLSINNFSSFFNDPIHSGRTTKLLFDINRDSKLSSSFNSAK